MDTTILVRILIAIVFGVALIVLAQRMQNQPNRKRSFQLGAAALACFTVFNAGLGMGVGFSTLQQVVGVVGFGLFIASAASLVLAFRTGETRAAREKARAELQAFTKQREAENEKR
jgi:drug/metabolite transporter (DMT)-like permease